MENRRPKIWILVLVVLTVAALGYTFAGASSLKATADKVEYVQKTAYGDPSAAEGVSVTYSNSPGGHKQLKWLTDLKVDRGKEDIAVSHVYSDDHVLSTGGQYKDRISIYADFEDIPELKAVVKETARGLAENSNKQISINIAEYLEYAPLTAHYAVGTVAFSPGRSTDPETGNVIKSDKVDKVLNELFRIKVSDDTSVMLLVRRFSDRNGEMDYDYDIEYFESGLSYGSAWLGMIEGRLYDGAYYIYSYFGNDGRSTLQYYSMDPLADGSNPYKVYRIPVIKSGQPGGAARYELDMDGMTVLGEYKEGFRLIRTALTEDGRRAMMLGTANDRYIAYIVDFENNGSFQEIDLCAAGHYADAQEMHYDVIFKDDYFVLSVDGDGYYVVHPDRGSYAVFHAPTDGKIEEEEIARIRTDRWDHGKPYDVKFANGKLVVASFAAGKYEFVVDGQPYTRVQGDGIILAVYTKDGLQYFTRYTSSLFELDSQLILDDACSVEIH